MFKVVEKNNPLALHCIAETLDRAEEWSKVSGACYCARGYFMDKTLTPDSFMIIKQEAKPCTK